MGSQVLSPHMEAKFQLLSLKEPLQYGSFSLKLGLDYFMEQNIFVGLMLRVGFSFLPDPTLNISPKPHLQKVLTCRHPCHTWDPRLGTPCEVVSPHFMLSTIEFAQINLK